MQPVEQKILSRIYGRGRGWAFTKTDFVADFGEANIHKALSALTKAGTIRRVCVGVYDYPRQSELLGQALSPDIDQVAQALARKFNWRIQAFGRYGAESAGSLDAGAGKMDLPFRWPQSELRDWRAGTLAFRKAALKDTGFALRESGLLVPAIKALGKEHVDAAVVEKLRQWLDPKVTRAPAARYAHGGGLDLRNHQAGL
jgi:hypothetical protein